MDETECWYFYLKEITVIEVLLRKRNFKRTIFSMGHTEVFPTYKKNQPFYILDLLFPQHSHSKVFDENGSYNGNRLIFLTYMLIK